VEITTGSREVPWRKSLWQEKATPTQNNNNDDDDDNNNTLDLHNLFCVFRNTNIEIKNTSVG
jgi:hypothetical protein